MSPEWLQDEEGALFLQDDDGDLYGVAEDGALVDSTGERWLVSDDGDLVSADEAQHDAALRTLTQNALKLSGSLPRHLTQREEFGILDVAQRLGTTDAKVAYERWLEENKTPHPSDEDEDTAQERMAERYEDLRDNKYDPDSDYWQGGDETPDPATADSGGTEANDA